MKNKQKKSNKKSIKFSIIWPILIVGIIAFFSYIKVENIQRTVEQKNLQAMLQEDIEKVGQKGIITEAVIIGRKTGTGPFDDDNEPGNDKDADNNIVRSFDQITWTIENTMNLKNASLGESYKGGVIQVKAELPENILNVEGSPKVAEWDVDSMGWAENPQLSDNGRVFTAEYTLPEVEVTVPGKQTLVLVLKVLGAPNGLEIAPKFTMNLVGNTENEKYVLEAKEEDTSKLNSIVKVSATPSLNVQLKRNSNMNYKSYFDDEKKDEVESKTATSTYGRMQGYAITLQLYNTDLDKEIKGIELPKGEIAFDLTFNELNGTKDITNEENYTPKMWEYKENSDSTKGKNQKNMKWNGSVFTNVGRNVAPLNNGSGVNKCYNGGEWNIIQDDENANVYHVRINEYLFDPEYSFPTIDFGKHTNTTEIYGKNIGCFSAGYIQTILQMPEEVETTKSIYMKAAISNLTFKTISDKESSNDEYSNDNIVNTNINLYPTGSITMYQHWHSNSDGINLTDVSNLSSNRGSAGDSYYTKGSVVMLSSQLSVGNSNDEPLKRINILQKFDDKAFEPLSNADKSSSILLRTGNLDSEKGILNTLYAAKPDKTGWIDSDEMQDTREEDLIYFASYQDLKNAGYICVGVLYENTEITAYSGAIFYYGTRLIIKDTAIIGEVYQTVNDARVWTKSKDFSWLNQEYTYDEISGIQYKNLNYPKPDLTKYNGQNGVKRYIKTAYDDNGQIIDGTHYGGYKSGNSLLIVGANLKVNKTVTDKNEDGSTKINYDIGKNEYDVNYQISPSITNAELTNDAIITGVNLKITDTLPKGLTYVSASSNGVEPKITKNTDGTTTLVWYKYNCSVNEKIDDITYTAHIDEETSNGTQFDNITKIEEIVTDGEVCKIGNCRLEERMSTSAIQVINLSSYAIYKTTQTPIIEVNGNMHFKVSAINKTDEDVNTFQLLDILPYNGDGRGTRYNGNYKVTKITMKQTNTKTEDILSNDNLKLYITENEAVREGVTAKDVGLGTGNMWNEEVSNATINKSLTGYAIIGQLLRKSKLEIDIELKTSGNRPEDKYENSADGQTSVATEIIQTPVVGIQVVKRTIDGKIWLDRNKDGVISSGEKYLSGVKVALLNEDGTKATNIDGNEISEIITGNDGYYKFEDMVRGKYKVKIEYDTQDGTREVTTKNVGSNIEINSKFNSNGETDTTSVLNNTSSPNLKVEHQNAGITYKDAKVKVHHYIEGTTNKVPLKEGGTAKDETIEGKINDAYTTSAVAVPEYYELVSMPENASGNMTKDVITVIYYYRLKKYPYTVKYIDKDTNEEIKTAKSGENKDYGTEITVASEKVDVEKYTYDSSDVAGDKDKTKLSIGTEIEKNVINLYYTKKTGKVVVKYVDKNTRREIQASDGTSLKEEKTDKVDEAYTTTKKEIDGYTFVEDTKNTTGTYTIESSSTPIEVIYYYKKNTKVITKYIDKTTREEIPKTDGSSSKEIKEGLEGDQYKTSSKNFENYVLVEEELPTNSEGTMTADEITVIYYYKHISSGVIEKHIDDITGEVLYNEIHTGNEGDSYNIKSKPQNEDNQEVKDKFEGYELIQEKNPTNNIGTMTINPIEVIYYYRYPTKVTGKYIDKITERPLTQDVIQQGYKGEDYNTENKDFENYELIKVPENSKGKMNKEEIVVTYYYIHKSAGVIVNYYDVDTKEKLKEEQKVEGHQGDDYNTLQEEFEKYDIVKERLPQNAKGKMTIEEIKVDYYYKKKAKVKVEHKDITTEKIMDNEEIDGHRNDEYKTEKKEYAGYDLVALPENSQGTMTGEDITVVYYYIKRAEIETLYVEEEGEKELAEKDIKNGHIGDKYETSAKDIENYILVKSTENTSGEMKEEKITVKYYYKQKEFNLKIEKWVDSVKIEEKNKKGQTYKGRENLYKLEIHKEKIKTADVRVTYKIRVTNTGKIAGFANEIEEIIPEEFEFEQSDNEIKWQGTGRKLTTTELEKEVIEPGAYREIEITLRWRKGDKNLGETTNTVRLSKTNNKANFKEQTEDDNKAESKMIITISTGLTLFKESQTIFIIITIVALILVGITTIKRNKNS